MYTFGAKSGKRLTTADEKLQKVANRALSFGVMDFSIIDLLKECLYNYKQKLFLSIEK